jgi:hypothetical protein
MSIILNHNFNPQELPPMSRSQLSDNAPQVSRRRLAALALVPALAALCGCAEKWAEVFPVSGTLKYDGQIPVGARLVLNPVNPTSPDAAVPTGGVKADGSFVISSYTTGDGAPPGEYIVTIQWNKFDEKLGGAGPNVLPEIYSSPKTSPIKVTVNGGGPTTLEPINISSKTVRAGGLAARR